MALHYQDMNIQENNTPYVPLSLESYFSIQKIYINAQQVYQPNQKNITAQVAHFQQQNFKQPSLDIKPPKFNCNLNVNTLY